MKKIRLGLLAVAISVSFVFVTKANSRPVEDYYQFYLDENGNPYFFAGASEEFILTGCKFGPIICGKIYTAEDVVEVSPGVYEVIAGHEENQVATYYRS